MGSEKGAVMVIAALILVTLLAATAIVIDVGQLYVTRSKLQATADSAAISGAYSVINDRNPTLADAEGKKYIESNINQPYQYTSSAEINNSTFTVNLNKQVNFYFAPIIGFNSSVVRVSATAAASTIISTSGIVPFGIVRQDFKFGEQYILKYGAGGGMNGNYGALDLGEKPGGGADVFRDNIKYGYKGEVKVGDDLNTETGNMAGPTDQGVSYRKSLCTNGCSYLTQIEANCPRVVIAPVIDSLDGKGNSQVEVVGFAAFFLEDTIDSSSKGHKDIVGRFLKWSVVGESGNGENFGLVTVRLIK